MNSPNEFIMVTHETVTGDSLLRFEKLVNEIVNNNYTLTKKGLNSDKKNFWEFSQILKEGEVYEEIDWSLYNRTQEEWDALGEGFFEQLRENKLKEQQNGSKNNN